MSDLSRLLDDVYGERAADAPTATPEVPEGQREQQDWSADAVLDEAFADWVTHPPPLAPGEHEEPTGPVPGGRVAGEADVTSPRGVPRSSFTDFAEEPVTATAVVPAATPQAPAGWHRDDDDILPARRGRRSVGGRSTDPAAVPSGASLDAGPAGGLRTVDAAAGIELPRPAPRRFRLRRG